MGSLPVVCLFQDLCCNNHELYSYCLGYDLVSRLCLFKVFSVDGCAEFLALSLNHLSCEMSVDFQG